MPPTNIEGLNTIIRNMIGDYWNMGTSATPDWVLLGPGFNTLDENPQAQIDTKAYISDASSTSIIRSYEPQFPFDTDLIEGNPGIMAIYDIGRNRRQGALAEGDYVRTEIFRRMVDSSDVIIPDTYPARRFRVAVEVTNISGGGAEVIQITGNFNGVGDHIDGVFNTATKTFTPIDQFTP